jgi:protein-S-isoprenylcysteine O-methyltransferase Ste14
LLNIEVVGPVVLVLSLVDVFLHIRLDVLKLRRGQASTTSDSDTEIHQGVLLISAISTILAFILVGVLSVSWILSFNPGEFYVILPLFDPPLAMWVSGLATLSVGVILHAWTRLVRKDLASNWDMGKDHPLFTTGPYARIRHPSYTSYFLSFIGLFLLIPSVLTLFLFSGVWGYNEIAKQEEEKLVRHFGTVYSQYMLRTGRFLPSIRF